MASLAESGACELAAGLDAEQMRRIVDLVMVHEVGEREPVIALATLALLPGQQQGAQ